jgi:hypothetical protein
MPKFYAGRLLLFAAHSLDLATLAAGGAPGMLAASPAIPHTVSA